MTRTATEVITPTPAPVPRAPPPDPRGGAPILELVTYPSRSPGNPRDRLPGVRSRGLPGDLVGPRRRPADPDPLVTASGREGPNEHGG